MAMKQTIISCAVTGASIDALAKHPRMPKTPDEIASACVEAGAAGAAIVHIHVRDPVTGMPRSDVELYRAVVERVTRAAPDLLLNITCGMDGELALSSLNPIRIDATSTLTTADRRVSPATQLRPDLASLDCGVMDFGGILFVARMQDLRAMATAMVEAGVKPELECFEFGHIENAKRLIREGLIPGPPLFQLCLGTGYGAPATVRTLEALVAELPVGAIWSAFGCGATEMPMVAAASQLGGHVRVGLEDNLYLRKGELASNGQLVANAREIIERMGGSVATPAEARRILGLADAQS
jgi:uncharacterized protein (DUF849 family)